MPFNMGFLMFMLRKKKWVLGFINLFCELIKKETIMKQVFR